MASSKGRREDSGMLNNLGRNESWESQTRLSWFRPHWERARLVPWLTLLATCLFTPGLVIWAIYIKITLEQGNRFVDLLGATPSQKESFNSQTQAAFIGVMIASCVVVGSVVALALAQLLHSCKLRSSSTANAGKHDPGVFRIYRAANSLLDVLMWLLLGVVVVLIMIQVLLWGVSTTVGTAVTQGTDGPARMASAAAGIESYEQEVTALVNQGRRLLASAPACVIGSSWYQQAGAALLSPLGVSAPRFPLIGAGPSAEPPFMTFCPSSCLNLGSFGAVVAWKGTCICGAARLAALQSVADAAMAGAVGALGGAGAMYLACTIFLISLSKQAASAGDETCTARQLKADWEEQWHSGFAADPADCVAADQDAAAAEAATPAKAVSKSAGINRLKV